MDHDDSGEPIDEQPVDDQPEAAQETAAAPATGNLMQRLQRMHQEEENNG